MSRLVTGSFADFLVIQRGYWLRQCPHGDFYWTDSIYKPDKHEIVGTMGWFQESAPRIIVDVVLRFKQSKKILYRYRSNTMRVAKVEFYDYEKMKYYEFYNGELEVMKDMAQIEYDCVLNEFKLQTEVVCDDTIAYFVENPQDL